MRFIIYAVGIGVNAWIVEFNTTIAWVVAIVVAAIGVVIATIKLIVSLVIPQKAAPPKA